MGSSCVLPAGVEKPRETTEPDSHDVRCITSALADVSPYGCYVRTAPLSWEGREGEKEGRGGEKEKGKEKKGRRRRRRTGKNHRFFRAFLSTPFLFFSLLFFFLFHKRIPR